MEKTGEIYFPSKDRPRSARARQGGCAAHPIQPVAVARNQKPLFTLTFASGEASRSCACEPHSSSSSRSRRTVAVPLFRVATFFAESLAVDSSACLGPAPSRHFRDWVDEWSEGREERARLSEIVRQPAQRPAVGGKLSWAVARVELRATRNQPQRLYLSQMLWKM
ncbi:hypothetical protein BCR34DRAFT_388975 [Clohesyomyces aquaticus]|uniref:Uncharacterized protein n=1 Tax=Clohesyomyces aquaticus TaxID=1231657 RepID=A0A1Y1ZEU7_9PLEO|nr:hypothetical protein BCR34DRAFT_388975 [Clohesyomyces aquaticus]